MRSRHRGKQKSALAPQQDAAPPPVGDVSPLASKVGAFPANARVFSKVVSRLTHISSSPLAAYTAILALQLKVIWGMWLVKDLTIGDTSYYYAMAKLWHVKSLASITWSPLYVTFYGSMLNFTGDAYGATITHRSIIVLALAAMILALMRQLLSPLIAWFVAAWWVLLPIHFDALYEVHLFALIPILAALLAVSLIRGALGRGVSFAALLAAAVLMRNELLIAWFLYAGACLLYEFRRRENMRQLLRVAIPQYGIPLALTIALCGFYYAHATDKWPALKETVDRKHTLNICQVYAFGYQQRHSDWNKSPWTDCQELMLTTFGKGELPLTDALWRNPRAVLEHVGWNLSLVPAGLQVLLFNVTAGKVNPDYAPVKVFPAPAICASLLVLVILTLGSWRLWKRRNEGVAAIFGNRGWTWICMLCISSISIYIIITQRPRPSYLFALGVLIMAFSGLCLEALLGARIRARIPLAWPLIAAALILLVPSHYAAKPVDRPLLSLYRAFRPFAPKLTNGVVVVTPGYGIELCNYLKDVILFPCQGIDYPGLRPAGGNISLNQVFEARNVRFVYVDQNMMQEPVVRDFLASSKQHGWETVALQASPAASWRILEHSNRRH